MFDATQLATLRALIERYIPHDDTPGGIAAGVDTYLMRFLQADGVGYVARYTQTLTALEHEALNLHSTSFAALSPTAADALIEALWKNQTSAVWMCDAADTLELIAEHCAEGFYSDPRHGANANGVSWQMLGFEERR